MSSDVYRDRSVTGILRAEFGFLSEIFGMNAHIDDALNAHFCKHTAMVGFEWDVRYHNYLAVFLSERRPGSAGPIRDFSLESVIGFRKGFELPLYVHHRKPLIGLALMKHEAKEKARLLQLFAADLLEGDFSEAESIRDYRDELRRRRWESLQPGNERPDEVVYEKTHPINFTDLYTFVCPY